MMPANPASGKSESGDELESTFPQLPPPRRAASSSVGSTAHVDQSPPAGPRAKRLGDYELLREIGRGGMGIVHLGRHDSLGRMAAIKVLSQGALAGEEQLARFDAEARIVAQLQHANIVRVFDLGRSEFGPFIAFEFVEGTTLADRIAGRPWPAREAAGLVRTLASAVEHAHEHGIVHRDLKPANVLIDTDDTPKITDFGLARAVNQNAGATRTGEIMGTPAYMSPEQASGANTLIGPATDIYSLGAILFELLTGTPPFRGTDAMAVVLAVLSNEPPSPRQLDRSIPRDLETICLKCLEKQSSRRYRSAQELADDLGRFLDGQPIVARPASFGDKAWKWARRHPAAAALLMSLAVGLTAFLSYAVWKNNQLTQALAHSDSNFREALLAAQRRIETAGQPAEQTLEEELRFFTAVRQRSDDNMATRYEGAIAAALSGQVLRKLSRYSEALTSLADAEATLTELAQDDSQWSAWYRSELAGVFVTRAQVEQELGHLDAAEASLQRGLRSFRELAQDDPENTALLRDQAALWNNLGILEGRRGNLPAAISNHRQALALKEGLVRDDPRNVAFQSDLIVTLTNLASLLIAQQQPADAAELLDRAAIASHELPPNTQASAGNRWSDAAIRLNLGRCRMQQDDTTAATANLREAVAILGPLVRDYPEVAEYQRACAEAEVEFGQALMNDSALDSGPDEPLSEDARKVLTEAIAQFASAVARYDKLAAEFPDDTSHREAADRLRPGLVELRGALEPR